MSISQDDANEATARGAFVLCLDVPPGISFGIDYMTWTVGDRFRGVKMVPPGVHFIYTRSVFDCAASTNVHGDALKRIDF